MVICYIFNQKPGWAYCLNLNCYFYLPQILTHYLPEGAYDYVFTELGVSLDGKKIFNNVLLADLKIISFVKILNFGLIVIE